MAVKELKGERDALTNVIREIGKKNIFKENYCNLR